MTNLIACCRNFVFFAENQRDLVAVNASDGSFLSRTTFHAPVCAVAGDSNQIAVAIGKQGDGKSENLTVFDVDGQDGSLVPVMGALLPHDGVQVAFTTLGKKKSILALNSGDIDCIDFATRKSTTLLGSVIAGTSFAVNETKSFIINADRDARIRVSHFPNTYEIESFALLHEEIVTSVVFIDNERFASADGDGLVVLWGLDGKAICSKRVYKEGTIIRQLLVVSGEIYAIAEGFDEVYVLTQELEVARKIPLVAPPLCMVRSADGNVWVLCFGHVVCLSGDEVKVSLETTLGKELKEASLEDQRVKAKKIVKKSNKDSPDFSNWRNPEKTHKE